MVAGEAELWRADPSFSARVFLGVRSTDGAPVAPSVVLSTFPPCHDVQSNGKAAEDGKDMRHDS